MILNEGGNIWPESTAFDQAIAEDLEKELEITIKKIKEP
jgi:hypothetical protein